MVKRQAHSTKAHFRYLDRVADRKETQVSKMNEAELKHVIALLLEDAKRLVQLEPNAGTKARIWLAKEALESGCEGSCKGEGRAGYSPGLGGV